MFKIKTYNSIAKHGITQFPSELYQIDTEHDQPDAILCRSQQFSAQDLPTSLRAIARAGAGVNNIPISECNSRGIPVFNTPGANANAVKELVLSAIFLCSRNLCQAWQHTQTLTAEADDLKTRVEAAKKQFQGFELPGKTIAVIGLGAVGVPVANACLGLGLRVIGFDPLIRVSNAWQLDARIEQAQSLSEAISQADFISLHIPLLEETQHLVNEGTIAAMKPGVHLINCARGEIVAVDALMSGLQNQTVATYVTDFPDQRLHQHPRVIMLPHIGASTIEAEENCALMAVRSLRDFLEHGNISNSVNLPDVSMQHKTPYRIAITNRNVPSMLGKISSVLADVDLNIAQMMNQSRSEMAYTLIDVDKLPSKQVLRQLFDIDGVLNVNFIEDNG